MKTIALCASVTAYKQLIAYQQQLENMGYQVLIPDLASKMKSNKDFSLKEETLAEKTQATRSHFEKINQSDAILVINETKHDLVGYIGPAVLMEMAVAFYLHKPIYLINPPDPKLSNLNEIQALTPHILNNHLSHLLPNLN